MIANILIEIEYDPIQSPDQVCNRINSLAKFACVTIENCFPKELKISKVTHQPYAMIGIDK